MNGADSRAVSPTCRSSTGTSRHQSSALALGLDRLLDQVLEREPLLGIVRQVADADAVAARRRQLHAGHRPDERIGDLQQDPGAVAGVRIGALRAAVLEVLERVERLLDDGVARLAPQLRDERDATGVVLVGGVVEASGPRWSDAFVHKEVFWVPWKRGHPGAAARDGR